MRGFVRWMLFWQLLGPGVAIGATAVSAFTSVRIGAMLAVVGVGLVLMLGWTVGTVVRMRRMDAALHDRLARGGSEILSGAVTSLPAPARLVRHRPAPRSAPQLLGGQAEGPSDVVVLTTLLPDGPRRLGALVPRAAGLRRGRSVVVAVHPAEPDVAVLDARVTPTDLAAVDADPRWTTEKLPTDSSVTGGWAALALWALGGLVIGVVLGAAAVALLS